MAWNFSSCPPSLMRCLAHYTIASFLPPFPPASPLLSSLLRPAASRARHSSRHVAFLIVVCLSFLPLALPVTARRPLLRWRMASSASEVVARALLLLPVPVSGKASVVDRHTDWSRGEVRVLIQEIRGIIRLKRRLGLIDMHRLVTKKCTPCLKFPPQFCLAK